MTGKDLLRNRHSAFAGGYRWQKDLFLQAGHVEWKQATMFNHLAGNLVFTFGELAQGNLFSAPYLVDQAEIGGGKHAQVLAILLVDALDIFGNHQLDARAQFGIRRLLTARSFAPALAAYRSDKTAFLDIAALDRHFIAAFESAVRELTQGLIEKEADVRRSELIGTDAVAQLGILLRISGVPCQGFPGNLT